MLQAPISYCFSTNETPVNNKQQAELVQTSSSGSIRFYFPYSKQGKLPSQLAKDRIKEARKKACTRPEQMANRMLFCLSLGQGLIMLLISSQMLEFPKGTSL